MTNLRVGMKLKGFCNGFFGRDSYHTKRIEAFGADWIVVKEWNGVPNFAYFKSSEEMDWVVERWLKETNELDEEDFENDG